MKLHLLLGVALLTAGPALAQTINTGPDYDERMLFNPSFIEQLSTPTRTAGGQPGAQYWQNTADYHIDARLDEKTARVSATVDITYTNNSPDRLPFVWLQVDQNLYRNDSRGGAVTPVAGGRFGNGDRAFRGATRCKP